MTARALLVHGLNAAPSDWDRLRPELSRDGWSVVAAELLGHAGRPSAPRYAVADFAADLPGGPWDIVIAHSLGGAASTARAVEPGWCRALVLLDPVWRVPAESVAEVAAAQREELSLTAAALTAARPHWHPTAVAAKLDGIARVRPEVAERAFTDTQAAGGWDLVDAAASLSIPTLVVRGDPAVFTMLQGDVLDAVRRRNPRVSTVTIPGTGHAPHRDDPDATVATVRNWLRSIGIG